APPDTVGVNAHVVRSVGFAILPTVLEAQDEARPPVRIHRAARPPHSGFSGSLSGIHRFVAIQILIVVLARFSDVYGTPLVSHLPKQIEEFGIILRNGQISVILAD